jgi:membrane protein YdbS with pleckstrin-like domain
LLPDARRPAAPNPDEWHPAALPPDELRPPRHRVNPRARWFWTVRALLGWLVVLGVELTVWLTAVHRSSMLSSIAAVTLALAIAHLLVMPRWRYRVHRWEQTDTAVYTQSGWFTQERRIAPIARIQTVDTHRGPLEQLFGLTNVTVTTASAAGPLHIRGLDRDTARELADALSAQAHASGGDAT